jgi:hypothetical protein
MTNPRIKDLRGASRRNFIRLAGVAGAAFGLQRSHVLNYLLDEGGSALADSACTTTNRSVHIIGGNGSLAWFQLLWPQIDVVLSNGTPVNQSAGFAYYSFDGSGNSQGTLYTPPTAGDHPFFYSPDAPWFNQSTMTPTRPVSAFLTGANETHTQTPITPANVSSGNSMLATVASIQRLNPVLLPVIGMDPINFGVAPGAPTIATVPSAAGMVDLFNSTASQGILLAQADKNLYETYYKAMLSLRDIAGRPTWATEIAITEQAANLLGKNLASVLTPTAADIQAYGLNTLNNDPALLALAGTLGMSQAPAQIQLTNLGMALITTAKAFSAGLTNCVVLGLCPGQTSEKTFTDPHMAFNDPPSMQSTVTAIGTILDAFYNDLAGRMDPACSSKNLDQTTIFTVHGDTPHDPFNSSAWPDATPGNANWMYVMGNGYLHTGWFGATHSETSFDGFDPSTGDAVPMQVASVTTNATGAAVAYAVSQGNLPLVQEFYTDSTAITGMIIDPPPAS